MIWYNPQSYGTTLKVMVQPSNFEGCTITLALYHIDLSVKTVSIPWVCIDFFLKGPCLFQEESGVIEKQMDK